MVSNEHTSTTPKIADASVFGDDAGFLSGLGISFDAPTPSKTSKPIEPEEPQKELVIDHDPDGENKTTTATFLKEDIIPTMKEARVVSRGSDTPTKIPKSHGNVSFKKETIKPKEQTIDAVGELIKQKTKEQQDLDRTTFQRKKPVGKGRKPFGNTPHAHQTTGKITVGSTRQAQKSQKQQNGKAEKIYKVSDSLKKKETIIIGDSITVKEFSEKMGVSLPEVMKVLLANKILVSAHANIDFDTASLIGAEFDVTVEKETAVIGIDTLLSGDLQAILDADKEAHTLIPRPPIVTIMGHVDHGKTKLLDYLRHSNVVAGEAGGITQSIGASQIIHNDQKITFIDTPGHELFTSLRARGAKITDIVIIVVAADDGVKPQTIEAINHAKDSGVPIIVAITKIDLGIHKLDEIKGQLAAQGLQPEDRGGDIMLIPCSAMTGQGVDDLLDAILLQYEMLERKYNPQRTAVGVVVEAHKDSKQGVTTSLLLMTGTLSIGDILVVHNTFGKVRKMTDRKGVDIKTATGGDPVMILGLTDVPEPGRVAEVVSNEKEANKKIGLISAHEQSQNKDSIIHSLLDKIGKGDKVQIKLILKADSFGSLEAMKYATSKVLPPENIEVSIVHADVGAINDSDILFAQAAKGIIIGYNVDASGSSKKKAEQLHVPIKSFEIIYQYIDYLDNLALGMVEKEKVAVTIGKLEVLAVFFKKGKEMIFGGKVIEGEIRNNAQFKVTNRTADADEEGEGGKEIVGHVTSLQRDKDNVNKVAQGYECGMKAKVNKKIEAEDLLEFFVWEER